MIYCNVCGAGYAHRRVSDPPFHAPCPKLRSVLRELLVEAHVVIAAEPGYGGHLEPNRGIHNRLEYRNF